LIESKDFPKVLEREVEEFMQNYSLEVSK
jgi:hypothetical protein